MAKFCGLLRIYELSPLTNQIFVLSPMNKSKFLSKSMKNYHSVPKRRLNHGGIWIYFHSNDVCLFMFIWPLMTQTKNRQVVAVWYSFSKNTKFYSIAMKWKLDLNRQILLLNWTSHSGLEGGLSIYQKEEAWNANWVL